MKKLASLLLACILLIGCFSVSVGAEGKVVVRGKTETVSTAASADNTNHKQDIINVLSRYVDINTFTKEIMNGISNCQMYVDISRYYIPESTFHYICNYIFYSLPEAFNVAEMTYTYYDGSPEIVELVFYYRTFADTPSEYKVCKSKMDDGANQLLQGIKGNNLGVVEKLLLLHDRLALWNTYDHDGLAANEKDKSKSTEIYTAYAALGERKAVCQGYAMAYMYLLNQIGVESYYCSSDDTAEKHGWNIVFVNGKKYHVDVTWDDTGFESEVSHQNFLRSSTGMYNTGHTVLDFDLTPTDTTYDDYFWQRTHAQFLLVGGEIYYMDNIDQKLKRYSDKNALCNVTWTNWSSNYSRLATDERSLFYTTPDGIYRFDLKANQSEKIHTASLGTNEFVAGVEYEDTTLTCYIYNTSTGNMRSTSKYYKYDYGYMLRDVNDDGSINNRDLAVLMQYINNWYVTVNVDASDLNYDGKVNNRDYALLMQYVNAN